MNNLKTVNRTLTKANIIAVIFSILSGLWVVGCGIEGETIGTVACDNYDNSIRFTVTDTGQTTCYDRDGSEITCPSSGQSYYGQDANYDKFAPMYRITCDGDIVIDYHTSLMWQKKHNNTRVDAATAGSACEDLTLGGFLDWRLPSIKELFSIADFEGQTGATYFIDTDYFDLSEYNFTSGDLTGTHSANMMGQTWSSTARPDLSDYRYFFNFMDGHLKSGPVTSTSIETKNFYRCVRGSSGVFNNNFSATNNGDTITDYATGLEWQQSNAQEGIDDYQFTWSAALSYCEALSLGGLTGWRLPNIKELQSIVDYTNETTGLNSLFTFNGYDSNTPTTGPFFWASTSHKDNGYGTYVCFGHCWNSDFSSDIHGPGAQRSDPKYDNGSLPASLGDQSDLVQANNYVRCVRDAD